MTDTSNSQLVHRYVDGTASAEEMKKLNAQLRDNPENRREFSELLNLDSALATVCEFVDEDASFSTGQNASGSERSDSAKSDSENVDHVSMESQSAASSIGSLNRRSLS